MRWAPETLKRVKEKPMPAAVRCDATTTIALCLSARATLLSGKREEWARCSAQVDDEFPIAQVRHVAGIAVVQRFATGWSTEWRSCQRPTRSLRATASCRRNSTVFVGRDVCEVSGSDLPRLKNRGAVTGSPTRFDGAQTCAAK